MTWRKTGHSLNQSWPISLSLYELNKFTKKWYFLSCEYVRFECVLCCFVMENVSFFKWDWFDLNRQLNEQSFKGIESKMQTLLPKLTLIYWTILSQSFGMEQKCLGRRIKRNQSMVEVLNKKVNRWIDMYIITSIKVLCSKCVDKCIIIMVCDQPQMLREKSAIVCLLASSKDKFSCVTWNFGGKWSAIKHTQWYCIWCCFREVFQLSNPGNMLRDIRYWSMD